MPRARRTRLNMIDDQHCDCICLFLSSNEQHSKFVNTSESIDVHINKFNKHYYWSICLIQTVYQIFHLDSICLYHQKRRKKARTLKNVIILIDIRSKKKLMGETNSMFVFFVFRHTWTGTVHLWNCHSPIIQIILNCTWLESTIERWESIRSRFDLSS